MPNLERVDLSFFETAPVVMRNEAFIAAPRSAVFAAISGDPAGWGKWFPGFSDDGRYVTSPPHGVDSVRTVRAYWTNYRETILAWDEGERWAFRVDATSAPMFAAFAEDYRLADEGDGTRFTWIVAYRPKPFMRLAGPLAPLMFRRMTQRAAAGLTRAAGS